MRPIKFRAWDKTTKSMIDDYVHVGSCGELYPKQFHSSAYSDKGCPDLILMQFTGLLDKNGKEIFEGDITKDSTGLCLIDWNDQLASFCLRRNGWAFDHFFGEAVAPKDVEVTGNIYENPELLGGGR